MALKFKTVSDLQGHLKHSILEAIEHRILEICVNTVRDYLMENVYWKYNPQGEYAYDRTFELLDAVTVGNFNVGTKFATFEVFMDSSKITANVTEDGKWNQHASFDPADVSEYIPLWIEEGTEGSLWDRDGAHYMYDSWVDLSGGRLAQELENALRSEGWEIVRT